jgi:hypothetical protein
LELDQYGRLCVNATQGAAGATPWPVTGTFTASLGGFTPSATGARMTPLTVTTSDSSTTLPTGAVVVVSNTGSNPMYANVDNLGPTDRAAELVRLHDSDRRHHAARHRNGRLDHGERRGRCGLADRRGRWIVRRWGWRSDHGCGRLLCGRRAGGRR